MVKNPPAKAGDVGDARGTGSIPWVGKIPWRREWQPTPVFLPGESHGQRSLAGYNPRGREESETTEPQSPVPHVPALHTAVPSDGLSE